VSGVLANLADMQRLQGNYREVEPLFRRALAIRQKVHLDSCLMTSEIYVGVAEALMVQDKPKEGAALLEPMIDGCDWELALPKMQIAYSVAKELAGDIGAAASAARAAQEFTAPSDPISAEPGVARARKLLMARILSARGKHEEAIGICNSQIAIAEISSREDFGWSLVAPLTDCQQILASVGRTEEASAMNTRLRRIEAVLRRRDGGR
jgi:hypothetical protein